MKSITITALLFTLAGLARADGVNVKRLTPNLYV